MDRNSRRAVNYSAKIRNRIFWQTLLEEEDIRMGLTPAECGDFPRWTAKKLISLYKEERMNQRIVTENYMNRLGLRLPNATVKKAYRFDFPPLADGIMDMRLSGLDDTGLMFAIGDNGYFISGTPVKAGSFPLKLTYKVPGWLMGDKVSELALPLTVNPDPRSLWKDNPAPAGIIFPKPDTAAEFQASTSGDGKDMVAASRRGRSHAQEGSPRDDHFSLYQDGQTGWKVLVVADGAGSASCSREGSRIACETVIKNCQEALANPAELEAAIAAYAANRENMEARTQLGHILYNILAGAAFKAHNAIKEAAKGNSAIGLTLKDFSTTLLCAVAKKTEQGWFVAAFWVGDGAIGVFDAEGHKVRLLGTPDEGQYAGQTRFLTMPSIFQDPKSLMGRVRYDLFPDFTALILMTDGVSDPMFETDNNLQAPARWEAFFDKLLQGFPEDDVQGVDLEKRNEQTAAQLLDWLNFWSPGNHDDRTIALLY